MDRQTCYNEFWQVMHHCPNIMIHDVSLLFSAAAAFPIPYSLFPFPFSLGVSTAKSLFALHSVLSTFISTL